MNKCQKCSVELDNTRAHLGYTECLECSDVEAYSAHTVYPHKTGGYVQPVSKTTSNNLKRMDRRSTGNVRKYKSVGGNWDKWLEQYYHNLYNPKPKRNLSKIYVQSNIWIPIHYIIRLCYTTKIMGIRILSNG